MNFYFTGMRKFLFVFFYLAISLFAETNSNFVVADSAKNSSFLSDSHVADSAALSSPPDSLLAVSLSPAEKCPSDSILSANYAKCQQALKIVVNSQLDKQNAKRDRSMEMAGAVGSFVGGALIGFLLGWLLL